MLAQRLGGVSHRPLEGLQTWPAAQTVVLHGGIEGMVASQPSRSVSSDGKRVRFIGSPR
jgi:hypothetical protein